LNLGECAGAGVPNHLHIHVVPRWTGDTNFMPIIGGARVLSDGLRALYDKLLERRRTWLRHAKTFESLIVIRCNAVTM